MDKSYKASQLIAIIFLIFHFGCDNDSNDSCNCDLIPNQGPCEAYFPKYYFDQEEKMCKEFIWGGCDGVVPFNTLEQCEECACN